MTDWNQTFEVAVVTRSDLGEVGISPEQIAAITDAQMQAIAQKMGDLYTENGYWQDLEEAYSIITEEQHG